MKVVKKILLVFLIFATVCIVAKSFIEVYNQVMSLEKNMTNLTEKGLNEIRGCATAYDVALGSLRKQLEETDKLIVEDTESERTFQTRYNASYAKYFNIINGYSFGFPKPKPYLYDATEVKSALDMSVMPFERDSGFVYTTDILERFTFKDAFGVWHTKDGSFKCDGTCVMWHYKPTSGESLPITCDTHINDVSLQERRVRELFYVAQIAERQGVFDSLQESTIPQ